jgi:hypothetical protein
MLKGIDINETIPFSASVDTQEPKTIFHIGNITHRQKMKLFQGAIKKDGEVDMDKVQEKLVDIFLAGVRKIENLGGKTYETIDENVANAIDFSVLSEVVTRVLEVNFKMEKEVKN